MRFKHFCSIAFLVTLATPAFGYNFIPTQQEFNTWDTRCQALYVWTPPGRVSDYVSQVSPEVVKYYKSQDKEGAWHYCAGLIYLQRAKSGKLNELDLKWATVAIKREILFTRTKANKNKIIYGETSVALAQYYEFIGEHQKVQELYEEALTLFPTHVPFVQNYALSLYQKNELQKSIDIILTLDKQLLESSAEFNYFLGVAYFKLNNTQSAQHYANRAYALGYPLTWLGEQLKKQGIHD